VNGWKGYILSIGAGGSPWAIDITLADVNEIAKLTFTVLGCIGLIVNILRKKKKD
jgi:hypothetical protein